MANVVVDYAAQSFPLSFLGILMTNPFFMFAVLQMVALTQTGDADSQINLNPFLLYLPFALCQCLIAFSTIATKFMSGKVRFSFMTKKAQYANLSIQNILLLGFIYSFGYFLPTLDLIKNRQIRSTITFAVLCLAYDYCFVTLFSAILLQRKLFKQLSLAQKIIPLLLAILAIVFALFTKTTLVSQSPVLTLQDDLLAVLISPTTFTVMISRVSHSFVVVSIRYFQIKSQARAKAWAKLSDISNRANFNRELDTLIPAEEKDEHNLCVPQEAFMRNYINQSPVQRQSKEMFKYFSFLTQTVNSIDDLQRSGQVKLIGDFSEVSTEAWDDINDLNQLEELFYKLQVVIAESPEIEDILNEQWRTQQIIHKDKVHKPWTRSYLYCKYKINEILREDLVDCEIYAHLFKHRDRSDLKSDLRGVFHHGKQNQRDFVYDTHVLADFAIFGKSFKQSFALVSLFDGLVAFPAIMLMIRLQSVGPGTFPIHLGLFFTQAAVPVQILYFLALIGQCIKGPVMHGVVFQHMKQHNFESNQSNFVWFLIMFPLVSAMFCDSFLHGKPGVQINFQDLFAMACVLLCYLITAQNECLYRTSQQKQRLIDSILPMQDLSSNATHAERKLLNRYQFSNMSTQIEFLNDVAESVGLQDFARLLSDCKAISNFSPLLMPILPQLDIRNLFDEFGNVRSTDWKGYFPGSVKGGMREQLDPEYSNLVKHAFKSRLDRQREDTENNRIHRSDHLYGQGVDNLSEVKEQHDAVKMLNKIKVAALKDNHVGKAYGNYDQPHLADIAHEILTSDPNNSQAVSSAKQELNTDVLHSYNQQSVPQSGFGNRPSTNQSNASYASGFTSFSKKSRIDNLGGQNIEEIEMQLERK